MASSKKTLIFYFKLFLTFFKIGAFVFGGGFAMIPIIQKEVVGTHKWISDEEFIDMIAVTQSAPGPVAVNSAVFVGYKLLGIPGAFVALLGSVLPSFLIILIFAVFLTTQTNNSYLEKFFIGVQPAIVALILGAGLDMGKKVIHTYFDVSLAALALILLLTIHIHPIILIIFGAVMGIIRSHLQNKQDY